MLISSNLIGWRKSFNLDKFHEQESRNYFPFAGSLNYDFDDKVGIIRKELLFLWMCITPANHSQT